MSKIALIILLACCVADSISRSSVPVGIYKIGVSRLNRSGAVGSAIQLSPGKLITNCHTVRDASGMFVIHPEGQVPVTLEKSDLLHDLCLLGAPAFRSRAPEQVPSTKLVIGQPVIAAGYGTGFTLSVTYGVITALYPYDRGMVVRTSAGFPKGASGGGLFDEEGRLVGVLTFRGSGSEELNYAIPTEWINGLMTAAPSDPATDTVAFWEDHSPVQPIFLRAAWLEYHGAWQALHTLATEWVRTQEHDAEAWMALGRAQSGMSRHTDAAVAFRRAVVLQPNSGLAWYGLALACHSTHLTEEFTEASMRLEQLDKVLAARLKAALFSGDVAL